MKYDRLGSLNDTNYEKLSDTSDEAYTKHKHVYKRI